MQAKQAEVTLPRVETCNWTINNMGIWESACKNLLVLHADSTPLSNNMQFCCFCGEKLIQEINLSSIDIQLKQPDTSRSVRG